MPRLAHLSARYVASWTIPWTIRRSMGACRPTRSSGSSRLHSRGALLLAAEAGRWEIVAQLAEELTARQRAREGLFGVVRRGGGQTSATCGRMTCMRAEIVPGVTADPKVVFGKPVIAGTRTPVAVILGQLAAGVSEQEVCAEYDLKKPQIHAALRYGAWLAEQEVVRATAS